MPLESQAQRRYLWATDPELAKKFEDDTPKGAKLPKRKRKTEHVADETEVIELKDFSDKERAKLAKKHEAMPGGGFPIRNGGDLRNAIQAVGRAKNPSAARAWIIRRAKELKLIDQLPATWELSVRVVDLEDAVLALGAEEFGDTPGHDFHGNQYGGGGGGGGGGGKSKLTEAEVHATRPRGEEIGSEAHLRELAKTKTDPELAKAVSKDAVATELRANPPPGFAPHPRGDNSVIQIFSGPKATVTGEIQTNSFRPDRPFNGWITKNGKDITPDEGLDGFATAEAAADFIRAVAAKKTGA